MVIGARSVFKIFKEYGKVIRIPIRLAISLMERFVVSDLLSHIKNAVNQ